MEVAPACHRCISVLRGDLYNRIDRAVCCESRRDGRACHEPVRLSPLLVFGHTPEFLSRFRIGIPSSTMCKTVLLTFGILNACRNSAPKSCLQICVNLCNLWTSVLAIEPLQGTKDVYWTQGRPSLRFGQPWATSTLAFQATREEALLARGVCVESRGRGVIVDAVCNRVSWASCRTFSAQDWEGCRVPRAPLRFALG